MASWWSIEVIDGGVPASSWSAAHGDALVESALLEGAQDWSWHQHPWGVVFEVAFEDEAAWERFLLNPAVSAALDAVPDPVTGLIIYKGRGGSSGRPDPRKPRPMVGSGAMALPLPEDDLITELLETWRPPRLTVGS